MFPVRAAAIVACLLVPFSARADDVATVRDLKNPVALTKAELQQLMPGAKLSRVSGKGSNQSWSNDSDGTMVVHSDNRMFSASRSSVSSKWHISDDGRYCILLEWKGAPEEWCRLIIKAGNDYYAATSEKKGAKVLKLDISK